MISARDAGLIGCRSCGRANLRGQSFCTRCGSRIESRSARSLQRVWAWMTIGILTYIPANIYPMLITSTVQDRQESNIMGGIIELAEYGSYGVALIVFVASILIPVGKFIAIGYLA
ncbi:MAG: paraquat-inducible protein A, partial [Pseudomonadota bacterium]